MTNEIGNKNTLRRRDVLRSMVGAGILAGTSGIVAPSAIAADVPRVGGRIRVSGISSSTADTLDPAKGALSTDYIRHYMVYSGLTQFDENLVPQLALAEEINHSDARVWTIKLRKDVHFHDGKPLTPADVVYSLLRHKDPATGSKVKTIADQLKDVTATGANELQIELTRPNVDFAAILGISHFLIVQDGATDFSTGIGTGPYKCTLFKPGIRTVGQRNENYWKPGKPYLDEIELVGIRDSSSRVSALLSGDLQLVTAVNLLATRRVNASPNHSLIETAAGQYSNLIMRQDKSPTNNPDFVLAMKHLFHREQIQLALFRGYARIGNDHPIAPEHRYFNSDLPQREYDPDRARYLLKKAGLAGAKVQVYASTAANGSVEMATLLQQSAFKVDLNMAVKQVSADGYWSNHWMKHPLGFGNINPRPTADLLLSQFFVSDAPWNETGWNNPQFDQLVLAARSETDEAKRKQMYGDMQTLIHDECGMGIPVFISTIDGFDNRLRGMKTIPTGGLMGYSFAEHVWWDD